MIREEVINLRLAYGAYTQSAQILFGVVQNMPKNTFFLAPGAQKFLIFNKRNDGTIITHINKLGKPGKGRSVTPTLEE
jgi:hypothetical protein